MDRSKVQDWINRYVDAWRSPGTAKLATLFTPDVSYSLSPWKPPLQGLQALGQFWEKGRSGPDEAFELRSEIVAVEGNTAVAKVEVDYAHDQPSQWRDMWIMVFDDAGLCQTFEEWPFAPGQTDGQDL